MDNAKARKETATARVSLHNGGRPANGYVSVSWRTIKNGKPSGKTFTKDFATEAEAEAFYNAKGEA
jgi:hypothetical protein